MHLKKYIRYKTNNPIFDIDLFECIKSTSKRAREKIIFSTQDCCVGN